MKETQHVVTLLRKYLRDELAPEERDALEAWADSKPAYRKLLDELDDEAKFKADLKAFDSVYDDSEAATVARMLKRIRTGIEKEETPVRRLRPWKWTAVAAAILIIGSVGLYFLNDNRDPIVAPAEQVINIPPGGNKAVLTLADGTTVDLSNDKQGIVIDAENLTYNDGTKVDAPAISPSDIAYNSVVTPKGGQYQIILADGTKVWLNAESTLKYPSQFANDRREVELIGEAYFEVNPANNPKAGNRPFIVKTKGQKITVLGTAFNLTAYPDENETRTTLVKGALRVSNFGSSRLADKQSAILKPGEETVLDEAGTLITRQADITAATAWKKGHFYFKNTSFEVLMRQIARWYDVEVHYEGAVPQEFFTGEMNRNVNLSTVIDFLKGSGINFRMEGNVLIVTK